MGSAIVIGPMMLAVDRGLAVLCIAIFLGLAALAERFVVPKVSPAATTAVVAGLIAARIGYVAAHWSTYAEAPLSMFAVWQGGFSATVGIFGAATIIAVRLGRTRALAAAGSALAISAATWFTFMAFIPPVNYGPFPSGISLVSLTGKPVGLDSFRGRPFVVNLWATWCGPCRRELPMLAEAASHKGSVPILLVNQGETPDMVAGFLGRERLGTAHVALDPDRVLSRAFETVGYPATAFVAADGTIVQVQLG